MKTRPLISLGDALRASAKLRPGDKAARDAIAEMLGLKSSRQMSAPKDIGAWKPSSTESVITAQRQRDRSDRKPYAPPETKSLRRPTPERSSAVQSALSLVSHGSGTVNAPDWFTQSDATLSVATRSLPPPPPEPLFGRVVRRGILSAALSTSVEEGDIDIDGVIDIVSDGRPLETLPMLRRHTTRRGAQVLLDRSASMDPFVQDQEQLIQDLDDILADDRLEVLQFVGCPTRTVGVGGRDSWSKWKPPAAGTPVLVVTDLGIGGPMLDEERAPPSEWLEFAQQARREGHRVIALVPYEAVRWPAAVVRCITAIHWSERTTAGETRRALRDAWRQQK